MLVALFKWWSSAQQRFLHYNRSIVEYGALSWYNRPIKFDITVFYCTYDQLMQNCNQKDTIKQQI